MSMQVRDQARRFITLVDELYNARVRLVCSAEVPPDALFAGAMGEEPIIDLESLQFEGAVEGEEGLQVEGAVEVEEGLQVEKAVVCEETHMGWVVQGTSGI